MGSNISGPVQVRQVVRKHYLQAKISSVKWERYFCWTLYRRDEWGCQGGQGQLTFWRLSAYPGRARHVSGSGRCVVNSHRPPQLQGRVGILLERYTF